MSVRRIPVGTLMSTIWTVLLMWLGFELKHLLADYALQPRWMLGAKTRLDRPGAYAHAGLHALLSVPVLMVAGVPPLGIGLLAALEFIMHFGMDFGKAALTGQVRPDDRPWLYWFLHGLDQMLHRLTYLGMTAIAVTVLIDQA